MHNTRYVVSSRGPFVSWPCSCPMLLQISSRHATYTPDQGARHGGHGITEPTGLARENLNRVELIISPIWGRYERSGMLNLTTPPDRSEAQISVAGLAVSRRALAFCLSIAQSATRARHAESRPAATVASSHSRLPAYTRT